MLSKVKEQAKERAFPVAPCSGNKFPAEGVGFPVPLAEFDAIAEPTSWKSFKTGTARRREGKIPWGQGIRPPARPAGSALRQPQFLSGVDALRIADCGLVGRVDRG